MMDLIINYDSEADILVLKIREGSLADEELLDNDVILGYDSNKNKNKNRMETKIKQQTSNNKNSQKLLESNIT